MYCQNFSDNFASKFQISIYVDSLYISTTQKILVILQELSLFFKGELGLKYSFGFAC